MATMVEQLKSALEFVDKSLEDGKINLTVKDPVVQVKAEDALNVVKPYILAVIVMVGIALLLFLYKKGAVA